MVRRQSIVIVVKKVQAKMVIRKVMIKVQAKMAIRKALHVQGPKTRECLKSIPKPVLVDRQIKDYVAGGPMCQQMLKQQVQV